MTSYSTFSKILYIFATLYHVMATQMNLGTVLYVEGDLERPCWSPSSLRLLITRMIIEDLLPSPSFLSMISDETTNNFVAYIRMVYNTIHRETSGNKKQTLLLAFTDALGGYIRHVVLPNIKYSFYAGSITYTSVEKIENMYKETKDLLKTNGIGWAEPIHDAKMKLEPHSFTISSSTDQNHCEALTLYYAPGPYNNDGTSKLGKSQIPRAVVPLPYFDRLIRPTVLAVPLKSYPLRSTRAAWGLNVVVQYYLTGYKCMISRQDKKSIQVFDNGVYTWMIDEVIPLLGDEEIYTVFGGVLRVLATLKRMRAQKINLQDIRHTYSFMVDGPPDRSAVWTVTKQMNIIVLILLLLSVWFVIGFLILYCRFKAKSMKEAKEGTEKDKCECKGNFKGLLSLVFFKYMKHIPKLKYIVKIISYLTGRSADEEDNKDAAFPFTKDCACFTVKEEVFNVEETDDESSYMEEDSLQRKSELEEARSGYQQRPRYSYSFGYDFQTSTSESPSDSDSELDVHSQIRERKSR